ADLDQLQHHVRRLHPDHERTALARHGRSPHRLTMTQVPGELGFRRHAGYASPPRERGLTPTSIVAACSETVPPYMAAAPRMRYLAAAVGMEGRGAWPPFRGGRAERLSAPCSA